MPSSSPTKSIETIIRSLKTMVTKEIGDSIWQRSYHDHIIRGKNDYQKIWAYIGTTPLKRNLDCFYNDERTQQNRCVLSVLINLLARWQMLKKEGKFTEHGLVSVYGYGRVRVERKQAETP